MACPDQGDDGDDGNDGDDGDGDGNLTKEGEPMKMIMIIITKRGEPCTKEEG